jgi:NAD-dependent SIR2 family protein deacetylase
MPLQEILPGDDRPLQDIADLLVKSHRVVVITGAGISTSCGIPDFRSKDGLYNLIPDQSLPTPPPSAPSTPSRKRRASVLDDDSTPPSSQASATGQRSLPTSRLRGQDLFDASVWKNSATTATFYQFIASLRLKIKEEVQDTSLSHRLIRALRDGGRLMRCYTQNIDGLEAREGLETKMTRGPGTKRRFMKKIFEEPRPSQTLNTDFDGGCEVVQLHGDLEKTRCSLCQAVHDWDEAATLSFLDGEAPSCERCRKKNDEREAKGKRGMSVGLLRPNIVLYGEEHPSNHLLAPFVPLDLSSNPEVLIIMGTSLKVFGLQKIVKDFAKQIHSRKDGKGKVIFVNRTKPAESVWEDVIDQYVAMDCDDWVRDLRVRREDLWLRQGELDLKVTKPMVKRKRKDREASDRPTKKSKERSQSMVSVENPKKPYLSDAAQHWPTYYEGAEPPNSSPNRDVGIDAGRHPQGAPSTPQRPRTWKQTMFENPLAAMLSPMAPPYSPLSPLGGSFKLRPPNLPEGSRSPTTPRYSPLRKSFKPPAPGPLVPHTPEQISYSPITPSRRKREIHVYPDPDAEIQESGDDAKAAKSEEMFAKETPIRRTRKPLSEYISNVERGMAWTTVSTEDKSNELVSYAPMAFCLKDDSRDSQASFVHTTRRLSRDIQTNA